MNHHRLKRHVNLHLVDQMLFAEFLVKPHPAHAYLITLGLHLTVGLSVSPIVNVALTRLV